MKKVTRIFIAEKSEKKRKFLKSFLKKYEEFKVISEAEDGKRALKLIKQIYPDVLFVNTDLPGLNGIDLVKSLKKNDYLPLVIFFSANSQHAVEGFEIEALDYLVDPINPERLNKTIKKIKSTLSITKPAAVADKMREYLQYLTIQVNKHSYVVKVSDIIYISVDEGTVSVKLRTVTGTVKFRSLKQLESELDGRHFVRVHRKYLVNVDKIEEIVGWFKKSYSIIMKNNRDTEIQLSRRGFRALRHIVRG